MAITVDGLTPLIEVFDLPTSAAFYQDVLGFELISGDPSAGWCMPRHGETTLMLNTAHERDERPAAPEPERVRGHADTSLYFATADPDQVYAHLESKGWPAAEPTITSYGFKLMSMRDPDGFQPCFLGPVQAD